MSKSFMGLLAARFVGERQVTKAHRVESEVADRLVTNCGREMARQTSRGEMRESSANPCKPCQPELA